MDLFQRGFIFDGKIYFGKNPYDLPMKVISVKSYPDRLYIIDENGGLWLFDYDPNVENVQARLKHLVDNIRIMDVCEYGEKELIVLSEEGDLYLYYGGKKLERIYTDAKFMVINSSLESYVVAIDVNGNLWSRDIIFLKKPYISSGKIDLVQCTDMIKFKQAEYGIGNLICLDEDGNLYCIGSNTNKDLIVDIPYINGFTKLNCNKKFKKIIKSNDYTALIDVKNDLWICGKYFRTLVTDPMSRPIKIAENVLDVSVGQSHIFIKLSDDKLIIDSIYTWPIVKGVNRQVDSYETMDIGSERYSILEGMHAYKFFNNMFRGNKNLSRR